MTSQVIAHTAHDDGRVTVDVRHADTDSFTRSVDPAAMRWARTASVFRGARRVSLVDSVYAHTETAPRTWITTHTFEVQR